MRGASQIVSRTRTTCNGKYNQLTVVPREGGAARNERALRRRPRSVEGLRARDEDARVEKLTLCGRQVGAALRGSAIQRPSDHEEQVRAIVRVANETRIVVECIEEKLFEGVRAIKCRSNGVHDLAVRNPARQRAVSLHLRNIHVVESVLARLQNVRTPARTPSTRLIRAAQHLALPHGKEIELRARRALPGRIARAHAGGGVARAVERAVALGLAAALLERERREQQREHRTGVLQG